VTVKLKTREYFKKGEQNQSRSFKKPKNPKNKKPKKVGKKRKKRRKKRKNGHSLFLARNIYATPRNKKMHAFFLENCETGYANTPEIITCYFSPLPNPQHLGDSPRAFCARTGFRAFIVVHKIK